MQNMKNILKINDYLKIVIAFIAVILLLFLFSKLDNSYIKESKLYITEIMAKNTYTIKDDLGEYSDYIEIYNGYNKIINLLGYHLSDSEFETNKWTFPDIEVLPNSYLIIYTSSKDKCDENACHTNFKLSSKGETITLSDNNGNIINKFTYPSLTNDLAYGFIGSGYALLNEPSPGKDNSEKIKYSKISNNDIYINEYMTKNKRESYNSDGHFNDFVELYNNSGSDIELHNIFLSDDENNLMKYKIPDVKVLKDDYLLISLGSESEFNNQEIIANFKLGSDDKYLILSNGKDIIEKITLIDLPDNISYGKQDNKWFYFSKPTPGSENNTYGLDEIGEVK